MTAAARRRINTELGEGYGRPPNLEEVHACIQALPSHGALGGDEMEPIFLKAGRAIAQWRLQV
eukprot:366111-Chlamydomonas_euryale.AAC.17